jgi:hypothetical protein
MTLKRLLFVTSSAALLMACGDGGSSDGGGGAAGGAANGGGTPEPLPALSRAPLSTEERLEPTTIQQATGVKDPRLVEDVTELLADGFGSYEIVAGEPVQGRTLDDSAPPTPGPGARLMARFVHLADIQLADDESPARVCNVDSPMGLTGGAFRPQEAHTCHILNTAVRTINKIHEELPLSLVLLGGDNADNAQTNEIDWILQILGGSPNVECDSGDDDDPEPGFDNDPKDAFFADGLAIPWVWVTGNHDILNQGNYVTSTAAATYVDDVAQVGTRDWSQEGGPIVTGPVVPDERRAGLTPQELLAKVRADGDGHGITEAAVEAGRAFYTVDLPGSDVRVIVIDTAAPSGSADGLLHREEVDGFLIPELDRAMTEGKWVIVNSHHSSGQLTDGGGFGGLAQDDAVLTDEFRDILGEYPNLLMHLAGHTHHHEIERIAPPQAPFTYWEVESAALLDFPQEMRVIELWELDNGFVSVRSIAFDYQTENDPIAEEGRSLAILDYASGWQPDGRGDPLDRNVELFIPTP